MVFLNHDPPHCFADIGLIWFSSKNNSKKFCYAMCLFLPQIRDGSCKTLWNVGSIESVQGTRWKLFEFIFCSKCLLCTNNSYWLKNIPSKYQIVVNVMNSFCLTSCLKYNKWHVCNLDSRAWCCTKVLSNKSCCFWNIYNHITFIDSYAKQDHIASLLIKIPKLRGYSYFMHYY